MGGGWGWVERQNCMRQKIYFFKAGCLAKHSFLVQNIPLCETLQKNMTGGGKSFKYFRVVLPEMPKLIYGDKKKTEVQLIS